MSLFKKLAVGALTVAALVGSAGAAFAAPAQSTTTLNIRSGPGTGYNVVDVLFSGEVVDVTECAANNWCYIEHDGPDGWVSASYLAPAGGAPAPDSPSSSDCKPSIVIGPNPSFTLDCPGGSISVGPGGPAAPPAAPAPGPGQVCFYTDPGFTGTAYCTGPTQLNALGPAYNDKFSSLRINGNLTAKLCVNTNLGGFCNEFTNDTNLGGFLNDKASSLKVTQNLVILPLPPVIVTPITQSTGPIALKQTFTANLDNGASPGGAGKDIWYEAVNPVSKFFAPVSGAKFSWAGGAQRGWNGCKAATYSSAKLSIWTVTVGSYVCYKTNQGKYGEFRLNGYTGTTANIGYTTWAN